MPCGHHNRHPSRLGPACLSPVDRHQTTALRGGPARCGVVILRASSSRRRLLSRASVCFVQSQDTLQRVTWPERSDTSHHRKVGTPASQLSKLTKSTATPAAGLSEGQGRSLRGPQLPGGKQAAAPPPSGCRKNVLILLHSIVKVPPQLYKKHT